MICGRKFSRSALDKRHPVLSIQATFESPTLQSEANIAMSVNSATLSGRNRAESMMCCTASTLRRVKRSATVLIVNLTKGPGYGMWSGFGMVPVDGIGGRVSRSA